MKGRSRQVTYQPYRGCVKLPRAPAAILARVRACHSQAEVDYPMPSPLPFLRTAEQRRLDATWQGRRSWLQWGPYLAERAWATVREDYGPAGALWDHFSHDQSRSRAYRWNEDGLAGFCDDQQHMCFALGLWNGQDDRLKERLFGATGPQGNHGEDVKELYWYQDSTPTHSLCKMRYRYPQRAYPYNDLLTTNAQRGYEEREYELADTGIFADDAWFDVTVTYAKAGEDDLLIRIDVHNAAVTDASLSLVPQLWFRNTWSWGDGNDTGTLPLIHRGDGRSIVAEHPALGRYHLYWQQSPEVMFTNNETNHELLFDSTNRTPWVKDAFHRAIVQGEASAINPDNRGTKAGLHFRLSVPAGGTVSTQLRLSARQRKRPFNGFATVFERREHEADEFFVEVHGSELNEQDRELQRQALAGMLWSKQFFHYEVACWYRGDDERPVPRLVKRNRDWQHMRAADILSMPDKWEYPWFAVWDTAFHCLPLAMTDTHFAKQQLLLMVTERYQHPNGQLPAYENALDDVNPPVHAWAALEIHRWQQHRGGRGDRDFLERIFHKLTINFTWWINRCGHDGSRLFDGGFLGMDNVSLFDRSAEIPMGGELDQADATAWMALFAGVMAEIAVELAQDNADYESMAVLYIDHFLHISAAINGLGLSGTGLWNEEIGFYHDRLRLPDGRATELPVRSYVGLMPLAATTRLDGSLMANLPEVQQYIEKVRTEQPKLAMALTRSADPSDQATVHLSTVPETRLRRLLERLFDEAEFLSAGGIRSLSAAHAADPVTLTADDGEIFSVGYEPAEGETDLFGGNSNWRGPIWFPINYLLVSALRKLNDLHGAEFTLEFPRESGHELTLDTMADELSQRLLSLFRPGDDGHVPWTGDDPMLAATREQGLHQFYEYFDGDTGRGLGAAHQTGWTGLIACLLQQQAGRRQD